MLSMLVFFFGFDFSLWFCFESWHTSLGDLQDPFTINTRKSLEKVFPN